MYYSRTPVTRTLKGNDNQFELAGGSSYWGRLNIRFAMLIIDSLVIFQHFSMYSMYNSANYTYLVKNSNTIMHSYDNTVL